MKYFPNGSRWEKTFAIVCLIALLYWSCAKEENYPDVPVITYNSFIPFCSGSITDSAYLKINFTDGNGDIGYPQQDAGVTPDFYVQVLVDSNGIFKNLHIITGSGVTDSLLFSYLIPDITPTGKDKELDGIIQINLESALQVIGSLPPISGINFNELEFKVWMYDRNGNKSNVITTPPVELCGN